MKRLAVICLAIVLLGYNASGQEAGIVASGDSTRTIDTAGKEDAMPSDSVAVPPLPYYPRSGEVDIFAGLDFNYRDITYVRQYDVLLHITPAVKWYFGRHWTLGAQLLIPIVNTYGDYYKRVRPGVVSLSREISISDRFFIKATGGLFSNDRYGIDLKMMWPVAGWFAFEGQLGLTGWWGMYDRVQFSYPKKLTGTIGGSFWIDRWDTQIRGAFGRYVNEDWGGTGELSRHFRHVSVGFYGQWSNKGKWNGGFKVVVMIPPYRRTHHTVNFRPASNFRLTYNYGADPYYNKLYNTDPEENERDGWFSRELLHWGPHSIDADFSVRETENKTVGEAESR